MYLGTMEPQVSKEEMREVVPAQCPDYLSDQQWIALCMYIDSDKGYERVAREMGVTGARVRQLVSRGYSKIVNPEARSRTPNRKDQNKIVNVRPMTEQEKERYGRMSGGHVLIGRRREKVLK